MKKRFVVEFEDGSASATGAKHDSVSMSYSGDERLTKSDVGGVPFVSGNGPGLVKLGEILIQMGSSGYKSGFHFHIREDFDEDKSEILIVGLGDSI